MENKHNKWDLRFMRIADLEVAQWSKDTSSKVGCVIVKDRRIISTGYNGMARGIDDDNSERHERPEKYEWFVHAEPNTIINAAREGVSTLDADMYVNWYPCHICASYIVQAGIKRLFTDKEPKWEDSKWGEGFKRAKTILEEGGVEVIFMNYESHRNSKVIPSVPPEDREKLNLGQGVLVSDLPIKLSVNELINFAEEYAQSNLPKEGEEVSAEEILHSYLDRPLFQDGENLCDDDILKCMKEYAKLTRPVVTEEEIKAEAKKYSAAIPDKQHKVWQNTGFYLGARWINELLNQKP